MALMHPVLPRLRRLWILGAVALPFLGLLVWSLSLIQSTQDAFQGFSHCSTWTLETGRHLEVMEDLQEKASALVHSENPAVESASVEAARDRLALSRRELDQRIGSETDPYLNAVDKAVSEYLTQAESAQRLLLEAARLPEGTAKHSKRGLALAAHAHLDHQHQTVLSAFHALGRFHKDMLEVSIRASQRNAGQLIVFAGVALLLALGFGIAGAWALHQRSRSATLAQFAQTLVDTIPDGVVAWNPGGEILRLNPGMTNLLGMTAPHLGPGRNLQLALSAPSVQRLEAASPDDVVRLNLLHASGALRAVEGRASRIEAPGGPLHVAVLRDISAQVGREREFVAFHGQIQVGREVAALAKDLERAINPMLLAQDLLQPPEPATPIQAKAWRAFQRGSDQATKILRQFSRIASQTHELSEIGEFDLQDCLQEVIESFHLERQTMAGIELALNAPFCQVRGANQLVKHSLELLIQRALDAGAGQGPIRVSCQKESGTVAIRIQNRGSLETELDLSRMFDPVFFHAGGQTDDVFGLFNVAETVKGMGGTASVALTSDGLTEFTLRFPSRGNL
jgi:signal transduction histidine kinase